VEIATDKDVDAVIHLILVRWEDFSESLIQNAEEFDAYHRLLVKRRHWQGLKRACKEHRFALESFRESPCGRIFTGILNKPCSVRPWKL
jgi:hypothetical protein